MGTDGQKMNSAKYEHKIYTTSKLEGIEKYTIKTLSLYCADSSNRPMFAVGSQQKKEKKKNGI